MNECNFVKGAPAACIRNKPVGSHLVTSPQRKQKPVGSHLVTSPQRTQKRRPKMENSHFIPIMNLYILLLNYLPFWITLNKSTDYIRCRVHLLKSYMHQILKSLLLPHTAQSQLQRLNISRYAAVKIAASFYNIRIFK